MIIFLFANKQDAGKATGIVTSSRITHSTPGGAYAHIVERNWESDADVTADGGDVSVCEDLASQLVTDTTGRQIKVTTGRVRLYDQCLHTVVVV